MVDRKLGSVGVVIGVETLGLRSCCNYWVVGIGIVDGGRGKKVGTIRGDLNWRS